MLTKKKETVSVRIDPELKKQTEEMLNSMGLTYSSAITMFSKAIVNEGKIPFEIKADPFYSKENQDVLRKSIKEAEKGKITQHDLMDRDK
ncbi:type II toxin-antitoxin system RelB/DinJ family antitoxin [Lentilactobacillus sunkii]|jgi:DNA-damage-inducible protein J|uniref:Bifunctional antitoxin/transcriptional repressor RelB n=2 Tax=Lentilactobacillus sunkii TaxID=481719 RepID=A0A1E7X8K2_9LACO|nr:type II toxin-antitoxin system RelB/DinJ family antitoxin [Lentilactobacillus sunkii]OFA09328.1 bifunctional antitoxin/transcriptional repressor RelB [Lentilactobacillus sunkii]